MKREEAAARAEEHYAKNPGLKEREKRAEAKRASSEQDSLKKVLSRVRLYAGAREAMEALIQRPKRTIEGVHFDENVAQGLPRSRADACAAKGRKRLESATSAPIRADEDDIEYKERIDQLRSLAERWRKVMIIEDAPVTPDDLLAVGAVVRHLKKIYSSDLNLGSRVDWANEVESYAETARTPEPTEQCLHLESGFFGSTECAVIPGDSDNDPCVARYLHRVRELSASWAAEKERAEQLEKQTAEADRRRRERQRVLDRRFEPIERACVAEGDSVRARCAELPGLDPSEQEQCRTRCVEAVQKRDAENERLKRQQAAAAAEQASAATAAAAAADAAAQKREQERAACMSKCTGQGRDQATCGRICK